MISDGVDYFKSTTGWRKLRSNDCFRCWKASFLHGRKKILRKGINLLKKRQWTWPAARPESSWLVRPTSGVVDGRPEGRSPRIMQQVVSTCSRTHAPPYFIFILFFWGAREYFFSPPPSPSSTHNFSFPFRCFPFQRRKGWLKKKDKTHLTRKKTQSGFKLLTLVGSILWGGGAFKDTQNKKEKWF